MMLIRLSHRINIKHFDSKWFEMFGIPAARIEQLKTMQYRYRTENTNADLFERDIGTMGKFF